ncbi:MAG: Fe-S cluster assembly sulfur transfer protein SufU [Bacteroidia bacterium]
MKEIEQLYQEIILDHNRYPRNYGTLPHYTHTAEGHNPLCGDQVKIFLQVENDIVKDISFEGKSCAICKASASVMTTVVKEKSLEEIQPLYQYFHQLVTQDKVSLRLPPQEAHKLDLFATVKNFPMRVKCATLPWHTLQSALHGQKTTSTEKIYD